MKTTTFFITVLSLFLFINYSLLAQTQKGDIITGGGVYFGLERSVAISDRGNRIIAGNETPSGDLEEFVAGFDMSGVLSVTDQSSIENLKVFPNPTSGDLTIDLGIQTSEVALKQFNVLGALIHEESFSDVQTINYTINGTSGIYLLQLITSEGSSKTIKIIKN